MTDTKYTNKMKVEDVGYVLGMTCVALTFPVSVPLLWFATNLEGPTSPWKRRAMMRRAAEEKENAHKKTYAYVYSQPVSG